MIIDMFAYDNHFIIRGSCSRMIIISSSGFMFAYDNDNVASIVVSMSCLRLDRFACTVCRSSLLPLILISGSSYYSYCV